MGTSFNSSLILSLISWTFLIFSSISFKNLRDDIKSDQIINKSTKKNKEKSKKKVTQETTPQAPAKPKEKETVQPKESAPSAPASSDEKSVSLDQLLKASQNKNNPEE